ncbi:hypothetical protein [Bordetella genomosp. 1]|uniref:Uncharacterized protein n=1 Tax=Bordetella genomosp. 1 TaxID=1395607 RepID=A0ABX4ET28_9BORD|nr:hypothetical protein [Bordetella genomosp. 1]OZI55781.1 hypothetical protein CAL27_24350 [Bordetella genomosp. 1]
MPLPSLFVRACLLALGAHAAAQAAPPTAQRSQLKPEWAASMERFRGSTDRMLGHAPQEKMALLVIPTLNLDSEPQRDFDDEATRERYSRQRSMLMRWRNADKARPGAAVGHGAARRDYSEFGAGFQTARGRLLYQVIPVVPGTYRLNTITYSQMSGVMPRGRTASTTELLAKRGLATLTKSVGRDIEKTGPWPARAMGQDDGLGEGCDVVLKFGGGCEEAAREYRWQVAARNALKENKAEGSLVPVLNTELTFAPIAEITLEEGEVVLTDGFVLPDDQPRMADLCTNSRGAEQMCAIESMTFERLPASIADFRQAPSAGSHGLPLLEESLKGLVYRAPKLTLKPLPGGAPEMLLAD